MSYEVSAVYTRDTSSMAHRQISDERRAYGYSFRRRMYRLA
jgi:hypothetical protein